MPATYDPIQSVTLTSNATYIEFSSIPSTYTDLVIVGTFKAASAGLELWGRLNGDATNSYSFTTLFGNGSTLTSNKRSTTALSLYGSTAMSTTEFLPWYLYLNNYADTNMWKTVVWRAQGGNGTMSSVNLWRNTSAITSIVLGAEAFTTTNTASGSYATLYGIAKA